MSQASVVCIYLILNEIPYYTLLNSEMYKILNSNLPLISFAVLTDIFNAFEITGNKIT